MLDQPDCKGPRPLVAMASILIPRSSEITSYDFAMHAIQSHNNCAVVFLTPPSQLVCPCLMPKSGMNARSPLANPVAHAMSDSHRGTMYIRYTCIKVRVELRQMGLVHYRLNFHTQTNTITNTPTQSPDGEMNI